MTKLGSKGQPAIVRVRTMEKAEEMIALCNEHGWEVIVGIEPDEPGNISDVERLMAAQVAITGKPKHGRNEPCPCGSGKKYKRCCLGKEK